LPLSGWMLPFVNTVTDEVLQLSTIPGMSEQTVSGGKTNCRRNYQRLSVAPRRTLVGFTLIEVMVVVAIVAILAALAAPSFAEMLRRNRLSAASSALQVSLNIARSEAIKRGADARVTVAANTTAGVWTNGWTVFVDGTSDANGGLGPAADTTTSTPVTRVEVVAAPSGPLSTDQTGSINYFIYNGLGRLISATGASANRSFWFFDGNSERYCLVLSLSGRVRSTRVASGADCPSN
jgi:type IV fimbrial biogenesis protein FimT